MFSKACEYGIKAVIHIAHKSQAGERVGIKQIAKAIDSPEAFTGKVLQQLSKNNIIQSTKGPSGGFWITEKNRNNINLRNIVEVLDGKKIYVKCAFGLKSCNDNNPCPIHNEYAEIRNALNRLHSTISIEDLAKKLDGISSLK